MDNLYKSLLKRKLESEISISMERKQKGEQFRVIDKAQIPKKPIEPDLKRIFMMTIAIGFGLGGGLAFLLEFLDSSYAGRKRWRKTSIFPSLRRSRPSTR